MKQTLFTLLLLVSPVFLNAQSIIQKVNDIKLSDDYVWQQYAHSDADTALVKAIEWLAISISNKETTVTPEQLKPIVKHINLKGKEVTRAFAYIKKSDIDNLLSGNMQQASQEVQDTPPAEEELVAEEKHAAFSPDPMAQEMMNLRDIFAAKEYLDGQIQEGPIYRYGSLKDTDDIGWRHLILFNQADLKPIAVLSPEQDGKRMNMVNGEEDSLNQHHGCYAIWFILKETQQ